MKNLLILLTVFTLVFSCKNEEKPIQNEQPIVVEEGTKQLEIEITCKTDKTDIFQVIFSQIELKNNREGAYIITDKLTSQTGSKKYDYKMFGDFILTKLQLKFGRVPKDFYIEKIKISYKLRDIFIDGSELNKYFVINKFINYDNVTKKITTKEINGKHVPLMTLRDGFIKRLFNIDF